MNLIKASRKDKLDAFCLRGANKNFLGRVQDGGIPPKQTDSDKGGMFRHGSGDFIAILFFFAAA